MNTAITMLFTARANRLAASQSGPMNSFLFTPAVYESAGTSIRKRKWIKFLIGPADLFRLRRLFRGSTPL